jgi:O-antigen/teichoic acid export membrane protein
MLNAGGSLAVNIGLNLLLIPSWGMTGAAVAWAASIVVNNTAALLEVRHLLRLRPFGPGYWAVAAASVSCFGILGLLLRAALGNTATAFVLTCVIGGLAYLLVIAKLWDHIEMGALVDSFRGTKRPDTVPHSPSG